MMDKMLSGLIGLALSCTAVWGVGTNDSLEISTQGLLVQKYRLNLIARNVANAFTLMTDKGIPYAKQYAIVEGDEHGVRVKGIAESDQPFGKAYDPSNPFSDKFGFVYIPNVNIAEEMVDLAYTNILYEANATTFKAGRGMYQQAIEILK